ncbi:MAG: hypothetical protein ACD_4C00109G0002 [uncultured bacterium (gcode 4)]|uniref:Uncharacterized protein n=1 Tax=uncultured bacterium (gcode 4) TaxID=1234023 RepID=K2GUD1_9BACT|nr:MAG: hypothetical protein ACD_4C00109G0002 [uncultured bacterium (gcode 4)]
MIFVKIFYAILMACIWFLLIKYRKNVYEWTWKFVWAETYLWSWWTILVIIMLWLLFIFFSITYPFWTFDKYFWWKNSLENTMNTSDVNWN